MAWDLVIRGGTVVTPEGVAGADVAIENGTIVEVGPSIAGAARKEIDARGLHVFPGLIDSHVHFNEPGRTEWEGIATGSAALAAGGGTCFIDMPLNAHPPTLDGPSFDLKRAAAEASSVTDFALWGGLTPGNLRMVEELADRGVVGFKAFMSDSGIDDFPRAHDWTLQCGMQAAALLGLVVGVHAENDELTSGKTGWMAGTKSKLTVADWVLCREPLAEADAIQRAVLFASVCGCSLHVVHVSNDLCVELASDGKDDGPDVTIETCPHYFMLSHEDVIRLGSTAKCAPPIRLQPLPDQLWEKVRDGTIDIIGSDHSPAPPEMKLGMDFMKAWGGVSGVQSTLAALLTREPHIAFERIAAITAANVAKRFRLPNKGSIAAGFDADLALVDVEAKYTLTREMLLDRHKLSPYVGRTFRGAVRQTIVRGTTVFQDGRIVAPSFRGKFVRPERSVARA